MSAAVPPPPFGAPSLEQLTGLVFELAAQLHVERVQRLALEAALENTGALAPGAVERLATQPDLSAAAARALDRAMAGLMRVVTEDVDPRTPLRAQAAGRATPSSPAYGERP